MVDVKYVKVIFNVGGEFLVVFLVGNDIINKMYVDVVIVGVINYFEVVCVEVDVNVDIVIGGLFIIDGIIFVVDDCVLLIVQIDFIDNGVYVVVVGVWFCVFDVDIGDIIFVGIDIYIEEGIEYVNYV